MRAPLVKAVLAATVMAGLAAPAVAATVRDPDPTIGPLVVGGQPATEAYPFATSLQTNGGNHFCGAALIRPNWVETAKHCVEDETPSSMQVRVGSINRTSGGTVVRVSRIVLHPSNASDVAVVQLNSSVPYAPIPIADTVPIGSSIRLLGWGATCDPCNAPLPTILQQLDTTVLADSRCGTGAVELCVSNVDGWRGACYGDSGGPAVIRVNDAWRLAGTTTAGTTAICGQGPSIYMDSANARAWIDSVVGGSSPPPPPPPGRRFTNDQDVPIPDLSTVHSPITVTGIPGNAPSALRVEVTIRHTYRGDLVVSLVAPSGRVYLLEDFPNNDSGDDVIKTYTVNAAADIASGTWRLRVRDTASLDTGRIDTWTLQF
jgi:Trypsin/Proprotein convertase P-domain